VACAWQRVPAAKGGESVSFSLAGSNVRQMYAAMLGQTAVLLGIAYFFVAHLPR